MVTWCSEPKCHGLMYKLEQITTYFRQDPSTFMSSWKECKCDAQILA